MADLEACPKCDKTVYEAEGYPAGKTEIQMYLTLCGFILNGCN